MILQSFRHRARVVLRGGIANPMRFSRASSNLVGVVFFAGMSEWLRSEF